MDNHWRSIVKAISWRVFATLVTFMVAYLLTREAIISIGIGFANATIKIFAFYSHERLWNKIGFGKKMVEENYIT
ncbi:MAG: DUF2061 domain-containing protein [Dehalococcoidales bacterium]|nr:DUF2061 domain-containing protein [Dehalococcoidales bacterium]